MLLNNSIDIILYMIPVLLFTIALHECSHSYVAYKLGDRSQKLYGRMTLDPFAHIDLIGFFSILLIGFGWGKPVYTDDSNFKKPDRDSMLVALAGPASNLIFALILTLILKLVYMIGGLDFILNLNNLGNIILNIVKITIQLNVVLAIFNLFPIHPFDGGKVVRYFLPRNLKYKFDNLFSNQMTQIIILIIIISGMASFVISPVIDAVLNVLNFILMM